MFGDDGLKRNGVVQTVLVVEDEPAERALFKGVLTRAGYSVVEAGSTREAQQTALAEGFPHLLVTNYRMPQANGQHNGLHLARWFIGRQPGIPVVVVTGHPEQAMADDAFHPSFICWHSEWELDSLASLVERLVGPAVG